MTLATHIVVGAAVARVLASNPVEAFVIGLATHYLLDSIVHWDYPLSAYSSEKAMPEQTKVHLNKYIFLDMGKVLLDVAIGFVIVFFVHQQFISGNMSTLWLLLIAALGAVLPDFIQFAYGIFKIHPLGLMQRFHHYMHAGANFNNRPILGISTQVCLIALVSVFASMFF